MFHVKQSKKLYKDFLVSEEEFELIPSSKYQGLLQTSPVPAPDKLHQYYESNQYISHSDDAKGLMNLLYYQIKKFNMKHKLQMIEKLNVGRDVLDYGCGTGEFVAYLNEHQFRAKGFEPNPNAFQIAKAKSENTFFQTTEILQKEKFNVITLWHVLEHIPNLFEELSIIKNALAENGRIIVAVPNYESYDARYYQEFWAAYDVPRHLWHFNQSSLSEILNDFGMIIESIRPMIFDSFYVSLLSEKYRGRSFGFLRAFIIGLISNLKASQNGQFSSLIYIIKLK